MILAEYFKHKGRDPYGLREKLIEHHEKTVGGETIVRPPSLFKVTQDKQEPDP